MTATVPVEPHIFFSGQLLYILLLHSDFVPIYCYSEKNKNYNCRSSESQLHMSKIQLYRLDILFQMLAHS